VLTDMVIESEATKKVCKDILMYSKANELQLFMLPLLKHSFTISNILFD
jgi:hypothetical protein